MWDDENDYQNFEDQQAFEDMDRPEYDDAMSDEMEYRDDDDEGDYYESDDEPYYGDGFGYTGEPDADIF